MSDFSDMLHRSCEEKTKDLDSGPVTAGDEGMFKLESVFSSLVGLYALFLTAMSICSLEWIKKSFNKLIIFLYVHIHLSTAMRKTYKFESDNNGQCDLTYILYGRPF